MKYFEKLVASHIMVALPYRAKWSKEDAIVTALHTMLTHLEQQRSYVRMLFVVYSSAFINILPRKLVVKLGDPLLWHTACTWISSFFSGCSQRVRVGRYTLTALSVSAGSPQGCVLSPLLYSLCTHDFTPFHHSNNSLWRNYSGGVGRNNITQSWCPSTELPSKVY